MVKKTDILDSWKEIAEYLERDLKTCRRWEQRLGLPVYRIDRRSRRSKVFAYRSEIDRWMKRKAEGRRTARVSRLQRTRRFPHSWFGTFPRALIAAALLLLLGSAAFLLIARLARRSPPPVLAVPRIECSSPLKIDRVITDGIREMILEELSGREEFQALPIDSAAGDSPSWDYILSGLAERREDRMTVHLRLIRIRDDRVLLRESLNASLDEFEKTVRAYCRRAISRMTRETRPPPP